MYLPKYFLSLTRDVLIRIDRTDKVNFLHSPILV
jgi:hypothetical protein